MAVRAATVDPGTTGPSDYAIVKRRVRDAGLLEKDPWFYARSIAVKTSALVACLIVFGLFRNPWVQAANAVVLAIVAGQLGFQLHDSGHRQMFAKGWQNAVVGLVTGNLLLGMSYGWWVDKHNRHHANPNHLDLDPDVNMVAISYSVEQALQRRGLLRTMARHQAYLFFPLLLLLGWSMHVSSLSFLLMRRSRHRWTEFVLLAAHLLLYVGLAVHFLGPWSALLVIVIHQCGSGFYMALVFAPNHKGMPQVDDSADLDFLRRQVLTSRNVRSHPLTDVWYGALNYQIEHHLFPTMSRRRVREAHLIVRGFCEERSIPYHEVSMLQSYRELLAFLHEVGVPLRARRGAERAGWSRP
jgi:fatty acid desaturase